MNKDESMTVVGKMGLVPRGIYNSTVTYDFLDFVYHNGASYVAKKLTVGHEPHENNEYWQLLAMSGIASTGIEFQESETRQNIQSGETAPTLFGKIKKWLSDLKSVALTGQYSDLENIPNINPLEVHYPGGELDSYNWINSNYSFVFGHSTTLSNLNIGYWVIVSIKKQTTYICLTAQGDKGIAYRFYDYNNGNPIWTDWVRGITANQILTTKEQIAANTDASNVAGATAVKALKSDLTNSISQMEGDLYYKPGDVIEHKYGIWTCGTLTGGNSEIWVTIPLDKPILSTAKATLIPLEFTARQNGGYLIQLNNRAEFDASGIKVDTNRRVNGIGFTAKFVNSNVNGFGGTNNDIVSVYVSCNIAFT